jgi:DNA-binding MarR family transcriptional regulator
MALTMKPKIAPISPLDAHLGYWLRFVSNQVSHAFGRKVAGSGVTVAEWVILRELYDTSLSPSTLAEKIGMTRGGVSKLTDRLVAKSLVARTTGGEDRRFQSLALTAKGRSLVPRLAALADQNDATFFGHLKPAERQRIENAMRDIVRRHGFKSVPME